MLNDTEIDMEELEARLYGQVHYDECDRVPSSVNNEPPTNTNSNQQKRYFTNFLPLPHVYSTYDTYSNASFIDSKLYGQLGFMLNPTAVNNIVVVQPPATQIFTNTKYRSARRTETLRAKRERRKARRLELNKIKLRDFKGFKEHRLKKTSEENRNQNVNLDDSSACEIIVPQMEVVVVSSDEETIQPIKVEVESNKVEKVDVINKTQFDVMEDDDVIFVEREEVEIINVDCDDEVQASKEASPVASSTEQNDFLESNPILCTAMDTDINSVSLLQNKENCDISDSESNSSTSDSQNRIFIEPAFESSNKEMYELSLDGFENYITKSKDLSADVPVMLPSTTCTDTSKSDKNGCRNNDRNSSDSSSESDYEETNDTVKLASNKKLPNLSPFVSDDDEVIITTSDVTVVSISSSDESSDSEGDVEANIELLNIEGVKILPIQETAASGQSDYKPLRFSRYWNDDMKSFYNESWGQENFSVEEEQKKMSDDPKMWQIIDRDLINVDAAPKGPRCHRCRQFGHKAMHCSNKSGNPKCILCGRGGHFESKCPNKLCSLCGQRIPFWTIYCQSCSNLRYKFCKICSMRGHSSFHCSDLWRRYHLTVAEGPVIRPQTRNFKQPQDRWCCGCGSQGHYEHECNYYIRTYPQTNPFIHCYDDIYGYLPNSPHIYNQNDFNQQTIIPPVIPNLLDLKVDETILQQQPPETPVKLVLRASEAVYLLSNPGVAFLRQISHDTDLQIKVLKHGRGVSANHVCVIEGSVCYRSEAVKKIKKYLRKVSKQYSLVYMFSKKQLSKQVLQNNFEKIGSTLPWAQLTSDLYKQILTYEKSIKTSVNQKGHKKTKKSLIRTHYIALNAVLIGKFQAGDGHYHLDVLKSWLQSSSHFPDEAVKKAYNYVFANGARANISYKELIEKIPIKTNSSFYSVKDEVNNLMETCTNTCLKFNLNKHLKLVQHYHKLVLQSNYSRRRTASFKNYCKAILQKISKRVHTL